MLTEYKSPGKIFRILDQHGVLVNEKYLPKLSNKYLVKLYEVMFRTRKIDEKAFKLQRSGKLGTFAQVAGQEAAQVGSTAALRKNDWVVPAFRESASMIMQGLDSSGFFLLNMGSEHGNVNPKGINRLPVSVPVGSQSLHAVGLGMAAKLKKKKDVIVTYFGDGATSEGECMEAMNFAGVFQAPVVFICQNNQWAISVPVKMQTHSKTLAQKANAFGFDGIQVDGNDVLAMYAATKAAVAKARIGKGPTLIEAITYRLADHTTADDASIYRTKSEVNEWKKKDPIMRFQKYLEKMGLWDKRKQVILEKDTDQHIVESIAKAQNFKSQTEDMFKYVYKDMTKPLIDQLNYILQIENESGNLKLY